MFPDQSTCARPARVSDSITILVHPVDTAAIAIGTEDSTICLGALTIFTAYYTQAGITSQFQWMVNGNPAGTNSPRFIPSNLSNGDIVSCVLIVDTTVGCVRPGHVLSNFIPITIDPVPAPVVAIQASGNDVCQGTPITFTADLVSGGTNPTYQWQLNGNNTGVTGPTYTNDNLADGDQVNVILTGGNLLCPAGTGVSSVILTIAIKPSPAITVDPADTSIYAGHPVPIHVTVSGNFIAVSWQPASGLSDPTSLTPVASPAGSTTYLVKVTGDNGCETNKTSNIKVYRVLNMPNAFTPGRAINNIFRIPPGVGLSLKEFSVFNRWGQRIFTTSDISRGWDGTFHGAACDTGTYAYFLTGTSQGKEVSIKGTVTLIR
jgi:gliding motility-associated-like protein